MGNGRVGVPPVRVLIQTGDLRKRGSRASGGRPTLGSGFCRPWNPASSDTKGLRWPDRRYRRWFLSRFFEHVIQRWVLHRTSVRRSAASAWTYAASSADARALRSPAGRRRQGRIPRRQHLLGTEADVLVASARECGAARDRHAERGGNARDREGERAASRDARVRWSVTCSSR
jgi:hypothetical protein